MFPLTEISFFLKQNDRMIQFYKVTLGSNFSKKKSNWRNLPTDESEKRNVALKRDLDTKSRNCEDLVKQMKDLQAKNDQKQKQVRSLSFY